MHGTVLKLPALRTEAKPELPAEPPAAADPPKPASLSIVPPPTAGAVTPRREAPRTVQAEKAGQAFLAIVLPAITFAIVLGLWQAVHTYWVPEFPGIGETWRRAVELFSDPFYDAGPNDQGIAWQVLNSLGRVMAGFALAMAVGIPLGFLMGMCETCQRAWYPLIQVLRPVSPLAWLPIGLLLFKSVDASAVFVIFITSIWPMILNTATGVKAVPRDYLNVAAVLRLGRLETIRRILLPATLPYVLTGMRLSLGIAWMVIVAAEMLTGGIGIGFFVWDEWNNLSVPSILVAIGIIGLVGIVLDTAMLLVQRRFDHTRA